MDWVLNHLQLVIALAGGVAWWLKQRKDASAGGGAAPALTEEKTFDDPELAERTRRIREEIQRKIEQRAKGYATEQPKVIRSAPAAPTPPLVRPVVVTRAPAPPVLSRAATARQEAERSAGILEQQRTLMEKLRAAEELKAEVQKRTGFEAQLSAKETDNATARGELRDEMRDPAALRRAFILREVLGPPVALKR